MDRITQKVCDVYLSSYPFDGTEDLGPSRWSTGGRMGDPVKSKLFNFYEPNVFDFSRLRIPLVTPLIHPSPQSSSVMTLAELVNEVINNQTSNDEMVTRAVEQMTGRLGIIGEQTSSIRPPMNGYNVSRFSAISELSRSVDPRGVAAILALADEQGVRERPLLVQLNRGQWRHICPKQIRVNSHMIGLTSNYLIPLPEHGTAASARLLAEFTRKFMTNEFWEIRIIGRGIVEVSRFETVLGLLALLDRVLPLGGGHSWTEDVTVDCSKNSDESLSRDLCWCAGERLDLVKDESGQIHLVRPSVFTASVDEDVAAPSSRAVTRRPRMLWDGGVSSNDMDEINTSLTSVTAQRERVMDKVVRGVARVDELEELGIDPATEYARWWNDVGSGSVRPTPRIRTPIDREETEELEHESSPESTPPSVPFRRPTSPTSPIPRRRKSVIRITPKILRSSKDTRQFEFHPVDPNLILAGSRSGVVSLIDASGDFTVAQARVDTSPILGLAWLRRHMNLALYGASSSGLVGFLKMGERDSGSLISHQPVGRFTNLSSITVNCTDDYFLVSGFSRDLTLYDTFTGKRIRDMREVHTNFINIVRFAHDNPHMYATSSFDSTCKIWDLRIPGTAVTMYNTPTLNVMCCFSPDDQKLLVSGMDDQVVQLSIKQNRLLADPLAKSIPATNSTSNYRRSVYLGDGSRFITAGTDENYVRVIDATSGESTGTFNFDGLLGTEQSPTKFPDCDPAPVVKHGEYIQSLRGHPIFPNDMGILLYPFDRSRASYICTMQIPF
jgi:hypothetical protein